MQDTNTDFEYIYYPEPDLTKRCVRWGDEELSFLIKLYAAFGPDYYWFQHNFYPHRTEEGIRRKIEKYEEKHPKIVVGNRKLNFKYQ